MRVPLALFGILISYLIDFNPHPEITSESSGTTGTDHRGFDESRSSFLGFLGMSSLGKWSRMYIKTTHNQSHVGLLVARLNKRKLGDSWWVYTKPDRTIDRIDVRDRRRVTARKQQGIDYEDFPVLTREAKKTIEEDARDLIIQVESRKNARSVRLKGAIGWPWAARNLIVSIWAQRMWCTSATLLFASWRLASYLEFFGWVRWLAEMVEDLNETFQEIGDPRGYFIGKWNDGTFELPVLITSVGAGALMLLRGSQAPASGARSPTPSRSSSPAASDVDSDGQAGHSLAPSDDENEEREQLRGMVEALKAEMDSLRAGRASQSQSRSSGATGSACSQDSDSDGGLPTSRTMGPHVDRTIARLTEFEKAIQMDRQGGFGGRTGPLPSSLSSTGAMTSSEPIQVSIATPSGSLFPTLVGSADTSSAGTSASWVDLGPLRDALRDPKERLLANLETLKKDVTFKMPGQVKERIAPGLLVQIYSEFGTAERFAKDWIRSKELEKNHVGHEMGLHCMTLDRMLKTVPEFPGTEGCETIRARIYTLRRAFKDVFSAADWRQPKGQQASKWKSKVRWDLASEIDWRALADGDGTLPNVGKDIQDRLQTKALFNKWLTKSHTEGAAEEQ